MERKFKDLMNNKKEVETDKTEILSNMEELDIKKRVIHNFILKFIKKQETLEKCYI